MNFSRADEANSTVFRIDGELDAVTAPQLRAPFDTLVAEGRDPITLDLSHLRLIDSSGVGAIVSLYKRVRANGGRVKIVGVTEQPAAIFKLLRLDKVFAEDAQ
jgi:anti-sigma B factor antagonist